MATSICKAWDRGINPEEQPIVSMAVHYVNFHNVMSLWGFVGKHPYILSLHYAFLSLQELHHDVEICERQQQSRTKQSNETTLL